MSLIRIVREDKKDADLFIGRRYIQLKVKELNWTRTSKSQQKSKRLTKCWNFMGKRNSCYPVTVEWLGHFRVSPSLCFKAPLSAKQVIWKWFFYSYEDETHYQKNFCSSLRFESCGFWNLEVAYWAMSS